MNLRLTPAVKALAIACFAVFLIQQTADQFFDANLLSWFGLVPAGFVLHHRFWQVFTYAFLHGDVMHLFLNLMMLVFFGWELEAAWGVARFLRYYFFCTISAGLAYLFLQVFVLGGDGMFVPMVGASGGIYGLLIAFGILFGERTMLFMMLFPMKAKHFVWIIALVELMSTVFSGRGTGLAGVAHLGGMLAGFLYLWGKAAYVVAKKRRGLGLGSGPGIASRLQKKRKIAAASKHLKLIINNEKARAGDDDAENGPKTWH